MERGALRHARRSRQSVTPAPMRTLCHAFLMALSYTSADYGADLKDALLFHADFDGTADARVALGDRRVFTAASYKEQDAAQPGLSGADVVLAPGQGRRGGALRFVKKN